MVGGTLEERKQFARQMIRALGYQMLDVAIQHHLQPQCFLVVPRLDLEVPERPHVPRRIPELLDQLRHPPSA